MENWKKKSGKNEKIKKMYPNNHGKYYEQQSWGPILLALIEKESNAIFITINTWCQSFQCNGFKKWL